MKEVVVLLFVITTGTLSAQSIPGVVEQYFLRDHDGSPIINPRFAYLCPEKAITHVEMLTYNRLIGIRTGEPVGSSLDIKYRTPKRETPPFTGYSQPSPLISVTSNPSERSASPAIF